MREKLEQIKNEALDQLSNIESLAVLDEVRVKYLGKKGELTAVLRGMKDLSKEERPVIGQMANEVRVKIESMLEEAKESLGSALREKQLKEEVIDVTMPAKKKVLGHRHPMNVVLDEIQNIFLGMGYTIVEGPEVEQSYYNFEALNVPENHPAKDEQDTFYLGGDYLLRTQTSPVQVRTMEKSKPPIRVLAPGRVFRSDEVDATHSPVFHQIEGLVVDKNITMSDLKGALAVFAKELYGENAKVKFRPHHFPFTEPSAEMDVSCVYCEGEGCRICKNTGWIEILGCGMVHPRVLEMCGIDPNEYSGFAFGMGLERITMLKYGINDLRLFFENDMRFLDQF
ncbi:phenylalanine--tRNA ligase subunit alpha [Vallitalea okinawensis]|uniref:phenylalanine--tRNA ligase subunit alpha n=1 Tax=Vallitalea okinawensis TaxID=2078660 RepID=UPI000CFB6387|nr:phenylalanine--tRNA ligase subunit alpha [Vallitalea okinawensis]